MPGDVSHRAFHRRGPERIQYVERAIALVACTMPYELAWEGTHGVVATYRGRISAADLGKICLDVTADSRWDELRYVIADALDIQGVDVDTSSAAALAEPNILLIGAAHSHRPIHFSVVTRNPDLLHMLQRQRELGAFPYHTEVLESVSAARRWIHERLAEETSTFFYAPPG